MLNLFAFDEDVRTGRYKTWRRVALVPLASSAWFKLAFARRGTHACDLVRTSYISVAMDFAYFEICSIAYKTENLKL